MSYSIITAKLDARADHNSNETTLMKQIITDAMLKTIAAPLVMVQL